MLWVRSLLFVTIFYAWSVFMCLACLPALALPRSVVREATRLWARGVIVLLRAVCGVKVEVRGRQHMPAGRALIAAKHQCMLDVFAQFAWMPDACFVMRKELMRIPVFSWYARKNRMVVIDREGGARALRELVAEGRERLQGPRQLLIFPEAHRNEPGVAGTYHPGVAALYRDLDLPVHLVATNSGVHWPAHGFLRRPGVIVFEFLPPLPPDLKRADFMQRMESGIEEASRRLLSP